MKNVSYLILFIVLGSIGSVTAQTTLNGGEVTGPFTQAKSPYIIIGNIEVSENSTLSIEPGVEMLFCDTCNLNVSGSVQALGTNSKPIKFTAADTKTGWNGIHVFKNKENADSNLFEHCEFSYTYQITRNWKVDFGALLLDTVSNIRFSDCQFNRNTSFFGGAIKAMNSSALVNNCSFTSNLALDTGINVPAGSLGPEGSCIWAMNSSFYISNTTFRNNKSLAPNYPMENIPGEERAGEMLSFWGEKVVITNCLFENNHSNSDGLVQYAGGYFPERKNDTCIIENSRFLNNTISSGYILELDGSEKGYMRGFVRNCEFRNNLSLNEGMGSVIFCYNNNGQLNNIEIDRCILVGNVMRNGFYMASGSHVVLSNSEVYGQKGTAVEVRGASTPVVNCIIANNWGGVESAFNGETHLINTLITSNGRIDTSAPFAKGESYYYSYGILVSDRGKVNLYNSLVLGNKGHLGQMANLIGSKRTFFQGELYRSILEGGLDSSYLQGYEEKWAPEGQMTFAKVDQLIREVPQFKTPSNGIGVNYYLPKNDWHVNETCDSSQIFNKGINYRYISGLPYSIWPAGIDFEGNYRIRCAQMDIGPYEQKGPKGYTFLDEPWGDTTLCSNNLAVFDPQICGHTVSYRWQMSTNGTNWTELSASDFNENRLIDPKKGFYRVITNQKECSVTDTFGVANLGVLLAPEPDLGFDKSMYYKDTMWLTPGDFPTYTWNTPGGDTSHVRIIGARYKHLNSKVFWCEVSASNGCTARDSIRVTFKETNNGLEIKQLPLGAIYPNPTQSLLHINLPSTIKGRYTVSVFDLMGRLCIQQTYTQLERFQTLDISELKNAEYLVEINTIDQHYFTRILKTDTP